MRFFGLVIAMGLACGCQKFPSAGAPPVDREAPHAHLREGKAGRLTEQRRNFFQMKTASDFSPLAYDVQKYTLRGRYSPSENIFKASVKIELVSLRSLSELVLNSAVQKIESVQDALGRPLAFRQDVEKQELVVNPLSVLAPDSSYEITVYYTALANQYLWDGHQTIGDIDTGLNYVGERRGDPVKAKVFYTYAEPEQGRTWMPSQDRPDDRAIFEIALTVPPTENVVSNGRRVSETINGQGKTVTYRTDQPQPTYLMAFAGGELDFAEVMYEKTPLQLWFRRGLKFKTADFLAEIQREMAVFEKLLGPYPHEKYAVVLLPEFGGGMEHTSVTFNEEQDSLDAMDVNQRVLSAHELAHQWFGDWVTVKTWDDLWVKEGMASLLEWEAQRAEFDRHQTGTFFGTENDFSEQNAVVDPSLPPNEKYSSGPYSRAAWLLNQIRSRVGEDAFWSTLRQTLAQFANSNVSTEEFLAGFSSSLTGDELARWRQALVAKAKPRISLVQKDTETWTLTFLNPEGASFLPFSVRRSSDPRVLTIASGESMDLKTSETWILDPQDLFPDLMAMAVEGEDPKGLYLTHLLPSFFKISNWPVLYRDLNPSIQADLNLIGWPVLKSPDWPSLLEMSASPRLDLNAMNEACRQSFLSKTQGPTQSQKAWLLAELEHLSPLGAQFYDAYASLEHCTQIWQDHLMIADLQKAFAMEEPNSALFRLLTEYKWSAAEALGISSQYVEDRSLRVDLVSTFGEFLSRIEKKSETAEGDRQKILDFFRQRVTFQDTQFAYSVLGSLAHKDPLPVMLSDLRLLVENIGDNGQRFYLRRSTACRLAELWSPEVYASEVRVLQMRTDLPPLVQKLLADPKSMCGE